MLIMEKDELLKLLKENLRIELEPGTRWIPDSELDRRKLTASIYFGNKLINQSTVYVDEWF